MRLSCTLRDLYTGETFKVVRDKNVIKPAPGTRECNCRNKVITRQLGPGMFQQMQHRECEQCENIKLEREAVVLSVHVEPGMRDGQEIRFFEEGEIMVDGEPGDLRVWLGGGGFLHVLNLPWCAQCGWFVPLYAIGFVWL